MIRVAGVNVPRVAMAELAVELRDAGEHSLADTILGALNRGEQTLSLSHNDRTRLIVALDDPPPGMDELRETLVEEHVERTRKETA